MSAKHVLQMRSHIGQLVEKHGRNLALAGERQPAKVNALGEAIDFTDAPSRFIRAAIRNMSGGFEANNGFNESRGAITFITTHDVRINVADRFTLDDATYKVTDVEPSYAFGEKMAVRFSAEKVG